MRWIDQLRNHPSIIMWVVFNEGWGQHDTVDITNTVIKVQTIGKVEFYIKKSFHSKLFSRLTPAGW